MKHILAFIFVMTVLLSQRQAVAQMLDDLFDEEELQSSDVGKASAKPAPKSAPAAKEIQPPMPKAPVARTSSVPEKKPTVESAPAVSEPERKEAPKTFSLSTGPQGISLPQLGAGKGGDLPNLGGNAKKKSSENLSLFEMRAKKQDFPIPMF